jgi:predicted HicB family RNase H-like nuclease
MAKAPSDYPIFNLRMNRDLQNWLRDYASRQGKSMSAIIKDALQSLKRKDEHARQQEAGEPWS